jgi:phosphoribosylformimino-5-aminoimidazole carboxamide ribotide isomerase
MCGKFGTFDALKFYRTMHIIPSFDLMDGRLVRLRQGDFDQKTEYPNDPLDLARELEAAGIRRLHIIDLDGARDAGAQMFSVGSVAVMAPDEFRAWVERFGADRFLVGADVRNRMVAVHGWVEQTTLDLFDLLTRLGNLGVHQISVTDIARDGELGGPAIELYRDILQHFPKTQLVASGGISSVPDLEELQALGCAGALVGKAFFEGVIPLQYFKVHSRT